MGFGNVLPKFKKRINISLIVKDCLRLGRRSALPIWPLPRAKKESVDKPKRPTILGNRPGGRKVKKWLTDHGGSYIPASRSDCSANLYNCFRVDVFIVKPLITKIDLQKQKDIKTCDI